jgi:hypothetical protein
MYCKENIAFDKIKIWFNFSFEVLNLYIPFMKDKQWCFLLNLHSFVVIYQNSKIILQFVRALIYWLKCSFSLL